jgi:hypothetical protein
MSPSLVLTALGFFATRFFLKPRLQHYIEIVGKKFN